MTPERYLCETSISFLRDRCMELWARERPAARLWVPDYHEPYPPFPAEGDSLDIVLLGGFLERFFETGNWPHGRFKLWVLSRSVRDVLSKLLLIPEKHIGIIPRYRLLAQPESEVIRYPSPDEPFTLVFSGRIAATKNIESLIWMTYYLQADHALSAGLSFCGSFDDELHFEQRIMELIAQLSWRIPPVFHGKLPSSEWVKIPVRNPLFVSLSTFICEDFGVSQAQAQNRAWPSLLSDWGGHREVTAAAAIKIHPRWIGNSDESSQSLQLKGRQLAAWFSKELQQRQRRRTTIKYEPEPLEAPESLTTSALDSIRREVIKKLGPDSLLLPRHGVSTFADSPAGLAFFDKYRLLFAGSETPKRAKRTRLLVLQENSDPAVRELCEKLVLRSIHEGDPMEIASERGLLTRPLNILSLASASEVLIPAYSPQVHLLLQFLTRKIPTPVWVYRDPSQPPVPAGELLTDRGANAS